MALSQVTAGLASVGTGIQAYAAKASGGGKKGGGRKRRDEDDDDDEDFSRPASGRKASGAGRRGSRGTAAPQPVVIGLTQDEKQALSEDVQKLSPEDTDQLLQIISERMPLGDAQG
jgi:phage gpG-like protein